VGTGAAASDAGSPCAHRHDAQVDTDFPAFWNEVKRRAIAEEVLEAEPNEDLELDARGPHPFLIYRLRNDSLQTV